MMVKKFPTPFRGEGAWVALKPPPWKKVKSLAGRAGFSQEEMEDLLGACIVDWNWVDEKGEKLPLPATPEVLGELPVSDVLGLFSILNDFLSGILQELSPKP